MKKVLLLPPFYTDTQRVNQLIQGHPASKCGIKNNSTGVSGSKPSLSTPSLWASCDKTYEGNKNWTMGKNNWQKPFLHRETKGGSLSQEGQRPEVSQQGSQGSPRGAGFQAAETSTQSPRCKTKREWHPEMQEGLVARVRDWKEAVGGEGAGEGARPRSPWQRGSVRLS